MKNEKTKKETKQLIRSLPQLSEADKRALEAIAEILQERDLIHLKSIVLRYIHLHPKQFNMLELPNKNIKQK